MQYRKMGNLSWEVSALGFGTMRLPVLDGDWSKIDIEEAKKMLRYAIDNGVNYVDTAWPYHETYSEQAVGEILKEGYREKIKLATKLPVFLVNETKDFNIFLNKQLEKLQTDHVDFYLIHGINLDGWKKIKSLNIMKKAEEAKAEGKIKHIAFSFHGGFDGFKQIIDEYNWEMTQIQFNYADENRQATIRGLEYAASKGIPVVIMEPLLGGKLAEMNDDIKPILEKAPIKRTPADWSLQYIWNHPGVSVVLSGMSTMEQVKENVESANNSGINSMSEGELSVITKLKGVFAKKLKVPCTQCRYCMPCPNEVDIPGCFGVYNDIVWKGEIDDWNRFFYGELSRPNKEGTWIGYGPANLCTQCEDCLEKCPQNIEIPERLTEIDAIFNKDEPLSKYLP